MQPSSWVKSQNLFERSILLDATQREDFLRQECEQDIELFAEVLCLLEANDNATEILQQVSYSHHHLIRDDRSHSLIGPYQIVEKIGAGGMGIVYKALDIRLERYLALKFLPHNLTTDERAKRRLIREAKAASSISHQHLCIVYDIEETKDGQIYIAMAYYSGKNLDTLMKNGPLSLDRTITAGRQIASGLVAAHAKSIIHRDIKPANLILNHKHNIKILDFGIAKFADMQNTDTGIQGGTVAYMSPEHIRGEKVDHRTDIWSTAIILFEMLSGKKPFSGDTLPETMHRVLNDPTPRLSKFVRDIPPLLETLIDKALTKDIESRYQTMSEFLRDLDNIAKQLEIQIPDSVEIATPPPKNSDLVADPLISQTKTDKKVALAAQALKMSNFASSDSVCAAISMANYEELNDTLDPIVFQQLVGLYLRGIKIRIAEHNGCIKTLIGNTIVCEINANTELMETSQRAVMAANEIHRYIQEISKVNNIDLNCFITITEISCSEVDMLKCATQLKPFAEPMDIFTSDMIYHAICSDYSGQQIDPAKVNALFSSDNDSLGSDKANVWKICSYTASSSDETKINNKSDELETADVRPTAENQDKENEPANLSTMYESTSECTAESSSESTIESTAKSTTESRSEELSAENNKEEVSADDLDTQSIQAADQIFNPDLEESSVTDNDPINISNPEYFDDETSSIADLKWSNTAAILAQSQDSNAEIFQSDEFVSNVEAESQTEDHTDKKTNDSEAVPISNDQHSPSDSDINTPEIAPSTYHCHFVSDQSFVGRTTYLQDIEELFATCIEKKATHCIHISGASGVGKTRMLDELQSMAKYLGFNCHHQINVEFGANDGLQLLNKITKSILSQSFGDTINAELSLLDLAISKGFLNTDLQVYLYDLLGLTPEKTFSGKKAAADYSDWINERDQTVQELFFAAAELQPLAIFVDDLQWADKASVASLVKLAAASSDKAIIIITTSHRNYSNTVSLLEKNLSANQFTQLELAALNEQQAQQLATYHHDIPADTLKDLLQDAKGMPLKIALMARYYQRSGKSNFSASVTELVLLYLYTLEDEDLQAIWAASIIGGIFSQSSIRFLMHNQDYQCQRLIDLDLISPYGKLFTFAQPLVYRAVYESMEEDTKAELHKHAAEWYSYVDYAVQAEHLQRANSYEAAQAYLLAATNLYNIFHLEQAKKYAHWGLEAATATTDNELFSGNLTSTGNEHIEEQLQQLLENIELQCHTQT